MLAINDRLGFVREPASVPDTLQPADPGASADSASEEGLFR